MIEIRIHGRGGQGNVVAAYLLAMTAFEAGRYAQAFPSFGAERRGAPVTAFVRIADAPIRLRCEVVAPAYLLIQDEGLLHIRGVLDGLLPGGGILVNSRQSSEALSEFAKQDIVSLPASTLAMEILGRPIPNTALLSAFLTLSKLLPQEALIRALAQRFKGRVLEQNINLANKSAEHVTTGLWEKTEHAAGA